MDVRRRRCSRRASSAPTSAASIGWRRTRSSNDRPRTGRHRRESRPLRSVCHRCPKFPADGLKEEIFGASSLLIRCSDAKTVRELLEHMEGQLTITLQMTTATWKRCARCCPRRAQGGAHPRQQFSDRVDVAHAVHGGPFPSTSDGRHSWVRLLSGAFCARFATRIFPTRCFPPCCAR